MTKSRRVNFIVTIVYWALILGLAYLLFKYFLNLVMPFLIALIMASLARPIAKWLSQTTRKKRLPDGTVIRVTKQHTIAYNIAAVITVILLYIILACLVVVLVLPFISIISDGASAMPSLYTNTIRPLLQSLSDKFRLLTGNLSDPVASMLSTVSSGLLSSLGSMATNISAKVIAWASSFVTSLPSALLTSIICMIASVFFAIDLDDIAVFMKLNLPERVFTAGDSVKRALTEIVWQFLRSYFIIFLITWAEIALGLLFLKQPYWLLIALLIAIFDAFPIVGSGMIMLPWSLITLFTGDTRKGIPLLILYAVVVSVRQIIEPRIVGNHVGLRPIVTLFCMYVGNKLFGGLGLFALPITAAILVNLNAKYSLFRLPGAVREAANAVSSAAEEEQTSGGSSQASPEEPPAAPAQESAGSVQEPAEPVQEPPAAPAQRQSGKKKSRH